MLTVKINNRGQITIPSAIRNQFGLHNGDEVALIAEDYLLWLHPSDNKKIFDEYQKLIKSEQPILYKLLLHLLKDTKVDRTQTTIGRKGNKET